MSCPLDLTKLIRAETIMGEDLEDTTLLKAMLGSAQSYMASFGWCPPVEEVYLAFGVGGVIAVFLFHFREKIGQTDDWLWVIEGDVPSAYLVLDDVSSPAEVLKVYCELMENWARAVLDQSPLDDVFPVREEAITENAESLLRRIDFIRTKLIPESASRWDAARGDGVLPAPPADDRR